MYIETLIRCMGRGWLGALKAPGVIIACWLANVVAALLFARVLWTSMNGHFGDSVLVDELRDQLTIHHLLDWLVNEGGAIPSALKALGWVAVLYVAAMTYLSGGFVAAAAEGRRLSLSEFHAAARRHFLPFTAFATATAILGYVLFTFPKRLLDAGGDWLGQAATVAWPTFWYQLVVWGVLGIVVSYVLRVFDYARVAYATAPEPSLLRAYWFGLTVPLRRFVTTLVLWLVPAVIAYGLVFALSYTYSVNGGPTLGETLWAIGATQIAILFRITGSCARLASAVAYAEVVSVEWSAQPAPIAADNSEDEDDSYLHEKEEPHEPLNASV